MSKKIQSVISSIVVFSVIVILMQHTAFAEEAIFLDLPIGIKIGTITIDADGTLRGTNVEVNEIDSDLSDYYGETVFFYIAYSITNGGPNDHVLME